MLRVCVALIFSRTDSLSSTVSVLYPLFQLPLFKLKWQASFSFPGIQSMGPEALFLQKHRKGTGVQVGESFAPAAQGRPVVYSLLDDMTSSSFTAHVEFLLSSVPYPLFYGLLDTRV